MWNEEKKADVNTNEILRLVDKSLVIQHREEHDQKKLQTLFSHFIEQDAII